LDPYVSEDPELGEVLDLLSDEYARDILAATSEQPMSANELAEQCGMSEPTVYRRISSLQEYELVAEQTKIETGGNDYKLYVATLSGFSLELQDGSFESALERQSAPAFPGQEEADTADRFKKMWENL
jgi:DNA-binding transcriptional ArsR family regulator